MSAQNLIDALQRLSTAVANASINAAFTSTERMQLVNSAQNLAWVIIRVNQNAAAVDQNPDVVRVTGVVDAAAQALDAVNCIGAGGGPIAALFDAIGQTDNLLPQVAQMYQ